MSRFIELVELLGEQNKLYNEIQEINAKLDPIKKKISKINDSIQFNSELYMFLCEKILNTYTKEQLLEVDKYRKQLEQANSHGTIFSINGFIFDPLNDSWYIYDYEQDGDKVRFIISCRKNEGSISGLMTFLDTHYTDWIKFSELEKFD